MTCYSAAGNGLNGLICNAMRSTGHGPLGNRACFACREPRLADIEAAHKRYCEQHLKNSSTRSVLASAFSDELAEGYMSKVMFDQPQD